jgi:DNA-directed RNA polymerase specialized sigma24 family protein
MKQNLEKNGLDALLEALGPGSAEAGAAYEKLRVRLIRFFRWNRCPFAEDLADEALDRLAGKLAGSTEPIVSPAGYVTGIARLMLLEQRVKTSREKKLLAFLLWFHREQSHAEVEDQGHEEALSHCLERLPAENKSLLERYYSGDAGERIRNRRALAGELGIAMNALRNRALRLRGQLEECVAGRMAKPRHHDGMPKKLTNRQREDL